MTIIERYIHEIKEAAKFLEENPDWTPPMIWNLQKMNPAQAIGEIVQELTED